MTIAALTRSFGFMVLTALLALTLTMPAGPAGAARRDRERGSQLHNVSPPPRAGHSYGRGYGGGYHDNSGAILGGALLGLGAGALLGGAILASPPVYAPPPTYYYAPPPYGYQYAPPPPIYYGQ
jgi:hypothetical protein